MYIYVHSDIIHVLLGQETCQLFPEVNVSCLRAILEQLECIRLSLHQHDIYEVEYYSRYICH